MCSAFLEAGVTMSSKDKQESSPENRDDSYLSEAGVLQAYSSR
jgi:hypothetical protein